MGTASFTASFCLRCVRTGSWLLLPQIEAPTIPPAAARLLGSGAEGATRGRQPSPVQPSSFRARAAAWPRIVLICLRIWCNLPRKSSPCTHEAHCQRRTGAPVPERKQQCWGGKGREMCAREITSRFRRSDSISGGVSKRRERSQSCPTTPAASSAFDSHVAAAPSPAQISLARYRCLYLGIAQEGRLRPFQARPARICTHDMSMWGQENPSDWLLPDRWVHAGADLPRNPRCTLQGTGAAIGREVMGGIRTWDWCVAGLRMGGTTCEGGVDLTGRARL